MHSRGRLSARLLAAILLAGAPHLAAQDPNLVGNGEFDQDVSGWSSTAGYTALAWNTLDFTECGDLSGSALFRHSGPAASQTASAYTCVTPVDDATIHSFGGELRFLTGQNRSGTATLEVLWVDAPDCQGSLVGTSVAGGTVHSSSAGNWVELRSDAAYAPAGAQSAQVVVRLVKVEAAGTLELRLDGFYLYAAPGHVFRDGLDLASTCRWTSEQLF